MKKAVDAGITVINIDNRWIRKSQKQKYHVPFVGPDNRKGARWSVSTWPSNWAGDEVGIIEGVSTTTNAQQRTAGFKDAMDAAQIKIVSLPIRQLGNRQGQQSGRFDAQRIPGPQGAAGR
jgi:ribose transport system substrate-binding protein